RPAGTRFSARSSTYVPVRVISPSSCRGFASSGAGAPQQTPFAVSAGCRFTGGPSGIVPGPVLSFVAQSLSEGWPPKRPEKLAFSPANPLNLIRLVPASGLELFLSPDRCSHRVSLERRSACVTHSPVAVRGRGSPTSHRYVQRLVRSGAPSA